MLASAGMLPYRCEAFCSIVARSISKEDEILAHLVQLPSAGPESMLYQTAAGLRHTWRDTCT
jgi:hypothetical protein